MCDFLNYKKMAENGQKEAIIRDPRKCENFMFFAVFSCFFCFLCWLINGLFYFIFFYM